MKQLNLKHILAVSLVVALCLAGMVGCSLLPQPNPTEPTETPTSPIEPTSPVHTHTPSAEASCTDAQICTSCKEVLVEAKGHDFVTNNATCSICGEKNPDYVWEKIDASCFTEGVTDYEGTIADVAFYGVLVEGKQMHFTLDAVDAMYNYARKNGYDGLRVHIYVDQKDGDYAIGTSVAANGKWSSFDVPMGNIDGLMAFTSSSTGSIKNYMWFEFINIDYSKVPPINAASFSGGAYTFADFEGTIYGREIIGIHATSSAYQPRFYFTGEAVDIIKAYAAENDVNTIRVYTYAILKDNKFKVGAEYSPNGAWGVNDLAIDTLDTSTCFWSQSQGNTELYMYFELVKFDPVITASSFTGNLGFYDFTATEQGRDLIGAQYVNTTANQPKFYFTAEAVEDIKAYAAENGYTILRAVVYVDLSNGQFVVNGEAKAAKQWNTWDISIDELSTATEFRSEATSRSKIWIYFEFA